MSIMRYFEALERVFDWMLLNDYDGLINRKQIFLYESIDHPFITIKTTIRTYAYNLFTRSVLFDFDST